jgi:uncharacterized protein DUF3810
MPRVRLRFLIVSVAVVAATIPLPARLIERYSAGPFVALQRVLTATSNRVPLALLDPLVVLMVAAWAALAWRDLRRRRTWWRGAAAIFGRTTIWTAVTYLAFLSLWGLNYRRVPLVQKLDYQQSAVTPEAALAVARIAVDRLNGLHAPAHAAGWPPIDAVDPSLAGGFARAAREVRLSTSTVPARPKTTMLDWYFRRSGTDGMTDPFFLETLVASSVLPFERPFIIAHEWSHLAGIGDEGEANFVGWLACVRSGPAAQYSGALFLYRELVSAVPERERSSLAASLGTGPRADLREIRARYEREVNPRLSEMGWRVYDSYLRANRVEAGAASYAEVVKLVLGVRLAQGW